MSEILQMCTDGAVKCVADQSQVPFEMDQELPGQAPESFSGELAGLMVLDSPKAKLIMAFLFNESTFLKLMGKMLDEEFNEMSPDLEATLVEFLNTTFGAAKPALKDQGYDFEKGSQGVSKNFKFKEGIPEGTLSKITQFKSEIGTFKFGMVLNEK